jgi:hypothetical protein
MINFIKTIARFYWWLAAQLAWFLAYAGLFLLAWVVVLVLSFVRPLVPSGPWEELKWHISTFTRAASKTFGK